MSKTKSNDYELLMLAKTDEETLSLLYQKYLPFLGKQASLFLPYGKKLGYDYDDLFQEASIAFYRAIEMYDDNQGSIFYTFLSNVIYHALCSYTRSARSLEYTYSYDAVEYEVADTVSPENTLLWADFYQSLRSFQWSLKGNACPVFELKMNGFQNREIAILLDLSLRNVENIVYTNKKKLLRFLQNNGIMLY